MEEWGIVDQTSTECFDTTNSNAGRHSGTCVLIMQAIKKHLLQFACGHHVFELVLEAAFEAALGKSNNPDIHPLLIQFRQDWTNINTGEK